MPRVGIDFRCVGLLGTRAKDRLRAVVAAFGRWFPRDRGKGALEEGVVYDVALVVFAFDDPVAGKGFALAGVSEDDGRLLALRGIDEKRSAGPKGVHKKSPDGACSAAEDYSIKLLVRKV
jgi:hypothetical protein